MRCHDKTVKRAFAGQQRIDGARGLRALGFRLAGADNVLNRLRTSVPRIGRASGGGACVARRPVGCYLNRNVAPHWVCADCGEHAALGGSSWRRGRGQWRASRRGGGGGGGGRERVLRGDDARGVARTAPRHGAAPAVPAPEEHPHSGAGSGRDGGRGGAGAAAGTACDGGRGRGGGRAGGPGGRSGGGSGWWSGSGGSGSGGGVGTQGVVENDGARRRRAPGLL
eukprot:1196136-Prorocentrum_minimum.AAC.7